MTPIEELSGLISGGSRVIVIATKDVDLQSLAGENDLVLMKILEGSSASGGRGGGFGERKVVMVAHFRYRDGSCEKLFETGGENEAAEFEVPYHVARMPIVLRDGADSMGYGVVDVELVKEMVSKMARRS